jgi:hypothetical protein
MRDKSAAWLCGTALLLSAAPGYAQFGRGTGDWSTTGADAARSSWVRGDAKISVAGLQKPGFSLVWKVKLDNGPSVPTLLTGYIGYRGFRSLGYVGTSADKAFALDTDLGRIEWQKQLPASGGACGHMSANVSRLMPAAILPAGGPQGGRGGRGTPAKSDVGEPGEGAVIVQQIAAANARAAAAPPPGRGPGRGGRPAGFTRLPNYIYALTGDGKLHSMYVSNGEEPEPPIPFLSPGAGAYGLAVVENVAYVATKGGCTGGDHSGVQALDIAEKRVASWKPVSGDVAGTNGPAIAPDETVFVTTTAGDLVALEPKTLKVKATYAAGSEFTTSPVIYEWKDKVIVAATTKDGRLHLVDAANPAAAIATPQAAAGTGALASWQDGAGTRWILVSSATAVSAWKVTDKGVETGWTSSAMAAPVAPLVINGVVFALSTGNAKTPAVLYALDGASGKDLWSSGKTMTTHAQNGAFSGGGTQVYVATHEGTLYTFGFPMEH